MKVILLKFNAEFLPGGEERCISEIKDTVSRYLDLDLSKENKLDILVLDNKDIDQIITDNAIIASIAKTNVKSIESGRMVAIDVTEAIIDFCKKVQSTVGNITLLTPEAFRRAFIISLLNNESLRKHPALKYIAEITEDKKYFGKRSILCKYKLGCIPEYINTVHCNIIKLW